MFTRCPQCDHIFSVSADQLRVAQGDVRCGSCAGVFNAIESLTDEPPPPPAAAAAGPDQVEPVTPPESAAASRADNPARTESAAGEAIDTDDMPASVGADAGAQDEPDPSLEFDAPEQDWSHFFIDAGPGESPAAGLFGSQRIEPEISDDAPLAGDIELDGDLEAITADPEEWKAFIAEMTPAPPWQSPASDHATADTPETGNADPTGTADYELADDYPPEPDAADEDADDQPVFVVDEAPGYPPDFTTGELQAAPRFDDEFTDIAHAYDADEVDTSPDALDDIEILPAGWTAEADPQPKSRRWAVAAAVLAISLGLQLLHYNRDGLAVHPRYGQMLQTAYARMGQPLVPEWPLSAYEIRRSEALAGGSAQEALDITAAIEVSSDVPVGLPLVRISLRDQWSNVIASRVFQPAEYLASELPDAITGGTLIPVAVSVVDPGTEARGYEVDVCVQRRAAGLVCQGAAEPFAP